MGRPYSENSAFPYVEIQLVETHSTCDGKILLLRYRNTWLWRRGATTAEKLREPRFGSQHRGACAPRPVKDRARCRVREGVAPSRCESPGYHPRKIFENSDAKSCILVSTCCKNSCFLKTTAKKLGDQCIVGPQPKSWGPVCPRSYGCCAYAVTYDVKGTKVNQTQRINSINISSERRARRRVAFKLQCLAIATFYSFSIKVLTMLLRKNKTAACFRATL